MFYRNPVIARRLPSPLLSLATFQLKGICSSTDRIWLSPYGVLQWTLMLDVPNNFGGRAHLDAAVHVVSLAVVEACQPLLAAAHRPNLGLKWPNDIYIASGAGGRPEKVGGVLVELLPERVSEATKRILIGQTITLTYNVADFLLQDVDSTSATAGHFLHLSSSLTLNKGMGNSLWSWWQQESWLDCRLTGSNSRKTTSPSQTSKLDTPMPCCTSKSSLIIFLPWNLNRAQRMGRAIKDTT